MRRGVLAAALAALLLPAGGPAPAAAQSSELPPAIAARVDGCLAVAVGRRRVTAAGCPGVGIVLIRLAPGDPDLPCHARAGRARTAPRRCGASAALAPAAPGASQPRRPGPRSPGSGRPAGSGGAETAPTAPATPSGCHPAYVPNPDGSCVPDRGPGDALDCPDIERLNGGVFALVDPDVDPYRLDVQNGRGNGWTCDDES